jgi:hypothetical protein
MLMSPEGTSAAMRGQVALLLAALVLPLAFAPRVAAQPQQGCAPGSPDPACGLVQALEDGPDEVVAYVKGALCTDLEDVPPDLSWNGDCGPPALIAP